jgi:elongation factor P
MATTSDLKNGMTIELNGEYYTVTEFLHVKPGKGQAFVRTKLKSVESGAVLEKTFKVGEKIEDVEIDKREAEYLYNSGSSYFFMDKESFEQIAVSDDLVKGAVPFLRENLVVNLLKIGDKLVGIDIPIFVVLEVTETEPGLRGDTVSATNKPAKVQTGAMVKVPLFIENGDLIKVDTRTGEYVERA